MESIDFLTSICPIKSRKLSYRIFSLSLSHSEKQINNKDLKKLLDLVMGDPAHENP